MNAHHAQSAEAPTPNLRLRLAQSIFSLHRLSYSDAVEFCTPGHAAGRLLHPLAHTTPNLQATSQTAIQTS